MLRKSSAERRRSEGRASSDACGLVAASVKPVAGDGPSSDGWRWGTGSGTCRVELPEENAMNTLPLHPAVVHVPLGLALIMPFLLAALVWAIVTGRLPARVWLVGLL